ncbi:MAG: HD domain-containing protein [Chitinivibrionales bacterium]|nr:HD domain-containing protein [Chitinivibrionales bacterium]
MGHGSGIRTEIGIDMVKKSQNETSANTVKPIAVIDIGSTSVRMTIAQVEGDGSLRPLESLQQEVSLGKDTFTRGYIGNTSIKECVSALKVFSRVLQEYGVSSSEQVRAVATSAVREAANRELVLDRIYSATGITVEAIDDAEVNRYTYLSLQPLLESQSSLKYADILIIEVGGGSTETVVVKKGRVGFSHSYRLGSFRMRETFEKYGAADSKLVEAMENQIQRTIKAILKKAGIHGKFSLLAIGGDARFAAAQLIPDWRSGTLAKLPVASLNNFTRRLINLSVDDLVLKYHLSFPDAETLVPALLTYSRLAAALRIQHLLVAPITMREGILKEIALGYAWTKEFQEQIIHSTLELAKKYEVDLSHSKQVCKYSHILFEQLKDIHRLPDRFDLILRVAALLHEIGLFISNRNHHKHSFYLIQNSNLFGLGSKDTLLTALVARYHRKAVPKPSHEGYMTLDRESRIAVSKMAALLRIADSLDRSYNQRIRNIEIVFENGNVIIFTQGAGDITLEQMAIKEKGDLFRQIYGLEIILRKA